MASHLRSFSNWITGKTKARRAECQAELEKETEENLCKIILKTGINKGNLCNTKIFKNNCCKRHYKE